MKRLTWITGLALVMSTQFAAVQGEGACGPSCDPCVSNPCDLFDFDFCDVEYAVYADYLFWKTQKGDLNYDGDDDEEDHLCPDHDAGWRLGAVAHYKNWDLGLRWTSFYNSDSTTDADDDDIKFRFDFDVLDLELGYTCCLSCGPIAVRPFAGVKFAWIEDKFDKSDAGQSDTKIDYYGVGLYLGTSARFELCSWDWCDSTIPIALVARCSTGIMDSEFEQDVDGDDDQNTECLYVPVHELYLGLDFTLCDLWCDMDAYFQIGYEVQYWGWREYNDNEDITHLGLGGLVVRVGTSF